MNGEAQSTKTKIVAQRKSPGIAGGGYTVYIVHSMALCALYISYFCRLFQFWFLREILTGNERWRRRNKKENNVYDKTLKITQKLTQRREQIMCSATLVGRLTLHTHTHRVCTVILCRLIFVSFICFWNFIRAKNASCLPFYFNFFFSYSSGNGKFFHCARFTWIWFWILFFSRRLWSISLAHLLHKSALYSDSSVIRTEK